MNYTGYQPYYNAINMIRSISSTKKPLEKMQLIASLSNEITDAVNEFWNDVGFPIENSLLDINADELMAIFIYILIKSNFPEIVYHLNLIKEFTTTITRNSMMGYYCTTVDAALIYINGLKDRSDLSEAKDKYSNNSKLMSNSSGIDE